MDTRIPFRSMTSGEVTKKRKKPTQRDRRKAEAYCGRKGVEGQSLIDAELDAILHPFPLTSLTEIAKHQNVCTIDAKLQVRHQHDFIELTGREDDELESIILAAFAEASELFGFKELTRIVRPESEEAIDIERSLVVAEVQSDKVIPVCSGQFSNSIETTKKFSSAKRPKGTSCFEQMEAKLAGFPEIEMQPCTKIKGSVASLELSDVRFVTRRPTVKCPCFSLLYNLQPIVLSDILNEYQVL
ncbi:unnamed protein product [Arctia plantaginis]|uniref:Uncharacterized protein n=1 Tax=Arctia plantaginis TaxID=874455 RepID=A0A8S0Z3H7_ARCPL|nr:unnamed protein product [Arctia plantaginis]